MTIQKLSIAAFQAAMEQLSWTQGRNIHIDYRWSMGDVERARIAAAELMRLRPEVIVSNASPATAVLQQATSTIPIVFVAVSEPMDQGFVNSLAHPGGNLTGFALLEPSVKGTQHRNIAQGTRARRRGDRMRELRILHHDLGQTIPNWLIALHSR
jgi:putative tryptophan/tyrosine transport system substrate-binding protein